MKENAEGGLKATKASVGGFLPCPPPASPLKARPAPPGPAGPFNRAAEGEAGGGRAAPNGLRGASLPGGGRRAAGVGGGGRPAGAGRPEEVLAAGWDPRGAAAYLACSASTPGGGGTMPFDFRR